MKKRTVKFDMPVVPVTPQPKKPKHVPKREVFYSELINNLPKPQKKKSVRKAKPTYVKEIAQPAYNFFSWKSLTPTFAGLLLVALVLQSVTYLNFAKSASGRVLGDATSAYNDLDLANQSLEARDFEAAQNQFTSAQSNLLEAQEELEKFRLLVLVAPPAKSADNILNGAYFLAEAGKNITKAVKIFEDLSVNSGGISTENITQKLEDNRNLIRNTLHLLSYAKEQFDSTEGLPEEYKVTIQQAKNQINTLEKILGNLVALEDLYLSLFGAEPKTYLLVFQNYDEIRATGGFIGTYGVLKYHDGKINQLKIESIYNIDGSMNKRFASPGPFQPEVPKWGLRDANWFADFPTSAQKILTLFEMESETADGVIALTPNLFSGILQIVGAIEMSQYDVLLTADNFQDVVQQQTSVLYDKELNQPKKFLDDFAPILLNRLSNLDQSQWMALFQLLQKNMMEKHVLVYSTDPVTQSLISALNYDGRILETEHDYLSVNNSNLGGTKTDLDIKQTINYYSKIKNDGSIINRVSVKRENTASETNLSFMRVLVPEGSKLISATGFADRPQYPSQAMGFEMDTDLTAWDVSTTLGNAAIRYEAGKTEFTGWVTTDGLTTSEVQLEYELPFKISTNFFNKNKAHSLLFQKQLGSKNVLVNGTWELESLETKWSTTNLNKGTNNINFAATGDTDSFFGMILGQ